MNERRAADALLAGKDATALLDHSADLEVMLGELFAAREKLQVPKVLLACTFFNDHSAASSFSGLHFGMCGISCIYLT